MRIHFFNCATAFFLAATCSINALANGTAETASSYIFETIDVPGALQTTAYGINDAGHIVGTYTHTQKPGQLSLNNGFLLKNGNFTTLEYLNEPDSSETAFGINNKGQIVGTYRLGHGANGGVLFDGGIFSTIATSKFEINDARGINDAGTITGNYSASSTSPSGKSGSYQLKQGVFTAIDIPGSATIRAYGINNAGDIVGEYTDTQKKQHGYLLKGEQLTPVERPGAEKTIPYGINSRGDIVGTTSNAADGMHSFLLSNGKFTTIAYPGATFTEAFGINSSGHIVGDYRDAAGRTHGFIARPKNSQGEATSVDGKKDQENKNDSPASDVMKLPF